MFIKRAAPKGVRKRPNPTDPAAAEASGDASSSAAAAAAAATTAAAAAGDTATAAAATAAAAQSDGSDEEHAKIAKRKKTKNKLCKHFLVGRVRSLYEGLGFSV